MAQEIFFVLWQMDNEWQNEENGCMTLVLEAEVFQWTRIGCQIASDVAVTIHFPVLPTPKKDDEQTVILSAISNN